MDDTILLAPTCIEEVVEDIQRNVLDVFVQKAVQRFDTYRGLGLDARVLGCYPDGDDVDASGIAQFCDMFERRRPSCVIRVEVANYRELKTILWPRDTFQVYEDVVIVNPVCRRTTSTIFRALTDESVLRFDGIEHLGAYESDMFGFGEGGFVVRAGKVLVVADVLMGSPYARLLAERGYEMYPMPIYPAERDPRLLDLVCTSHIDTSLNLAQTSGGNMLLVVNEAYLEAFTGEVNALTDKLDAKMCIIPFGSSSQMRYAVNFISLPGSHVALPEGCELVEDFLRKNLGKRYVHPLKIDPETEYSGEHGGMRCMSNVVMRR